MLFRVIQDKNIFLISDSLKEIKMSTNIAGFFPLIQHNFIKLLINVISLQSISSVHVNYKNGKMPLFGHETDNKIENN